MKIVSKVLAVVFVLMISGQHSFAQMRLSSTGAGEVLIFPFYSAAEGNETSFALYNTAEHSKALYLTFREQMSGAEVINFNLYLAPGDAFEASIISDPGGDGAALITVDASCTVPQLGDPASYPPGSASARDDGSVVRIQPFLNYQYADDSVSGHSRTLVGTLEVFELGQWASSGAYDSNPVPAAIEASAAGDRSGCDWLVTQFSYRNGVGGIFIDDPAAHASPWAGGGIAGEMRVLTQPSGASFAVEPVVIEGFARNRLPAEYHGTLSINNNRNDDYPVANLKNGALDVLSRDTGTLWRTGSGLEAISLLLTTTEASVRRQSSGAADADAVNDVAIVTFPTKYFHSAASDAGARLPVAPFESAWDSGASAACETIGVRPSTDGNRLFPYSDVTETDVCYATNILYSGSSPNLSSRVEKKVAALARNPKAISFSSRDFVSSASERFTDLPGGVDTIYGMPVVVVPLAFDNNSRQWSSATLLSKVIDTSGGSLIDSSDTADAGADDSVADGDVCSTPRPGENGSIGQITWDRACGDGVAGVTDDPGFSPGVDAGSSTDDGTTCGVYDPVCNDAGSEDDGSPEAEQSPFPNGADRTIVDDSGRVDVGSAGNYGLSGQTFIAELGEGEVLIYKLTVSDEAYQPDGRIVFIESSQQAQKAAFHVWISETKDGEPISAGCTYVGYVESALRVSLRSDAVCSVKSGQVYYLNMAYCSSDEGDIACRAETALSAVGRARVYIEAKYNGAVYGADDGPDANDAVTDVGSGSGDTGFGTTGPTDGSAAVDTDDSTDACSPYDPLCNGSTSGGASDGQGSTTTGGSTGETSSGSGGGASMDGGTGFGGNFQSQLNLESPKEGEIYSGIGTIQGWAIDSSGKLGSDISLYVDGNYRGLIAHGDSRGDVGSAYPGVAGSGQSGFSAAFNYSELQPGWHVLELRATDSRGNALISSIPFLVERFGSRTFLTGDGIPRATSNTSCRMVGSRILCSGIAAGGGNYSVWLDWNTATQNFEITRIQD